MKKKIIIAAAVLIVLTFVILSITTVSDGHIKIATPRFLFNRVLILEPGTHFVLRFFYSVEEYSLSPLELQSPEGFKVVNRIGSSRLIKYILTYQVDPGRIQDLRTTGGNINGYLQKKANSSFKQYFIKQDATDPLMIPQYQRELKGILESEISPSGIRLLALSIQDLSVDYGDIRKNELARLKELWEKDKRKIIVIGLDALDLRIMEPLLNRGELPNFAKLIKGGTSGVLKSIHPMLSPLIWTTMATGVSPEKHGILDFLQKDETGKMVPITSRMRKVPAIWNILSAMDIPVGFVAWWATWPAETVDGFMVSERLAYQLYNLRIDPEEMKKSQGKVFPPGEYEPLMKLFTPYEDIDYDIVSRFVHITRAQWQNLQNLGLDSDHEVAYLRNLIASTDTYHMVALDLYKKYKPPVFSVYFEATDTVGHLFMEYYPPKRDNVTQTEFEMYKDAVPEFYRYIDKKLGDYIALLDDKTDLIIVSDHGFKSGENRPFASAKVTAPTATQWHDIEGTVIMYGPSFKKNYMIEGVGVYDVLPTIFAMLNLPLDENMKGKVMSDAFVSPITAQPPIPDYMALVPVHGSMEDVKEGLYDEEMMKKLARLGYINPDTGKVSDEGLTLNAEINRANVLINNKQYKEAEKVLKDAVKKEPRLANAWLHLARIYRETGNIEAEADAYMNALKYATADERLEKTICGGAMAFNDLGKNEEAEALLMTGLKKFPNSYKINSILGLVYLKTNRPDQARQIFSGLLSKNPDDISIINNLALAYSKLGNFQQAEMLWLRSFNLKPEQLKTPEGLEYYIQLGKLYQQMQNFSRAMDIFQKVQKQDSSRLDVLVDIGQIYLMQKNAARAEESFKRALSMPKSDPSRPRAYIGLVMLYNMTGKADLGLNYTVQGLHEYPNDPMLHRFYGLYLLQKKDYAGAKREYQKVLEINKNDWNAMSRLGAIYMQEGRKNEAVRLFKQSLSINPNQPEVRQLLRQLGAY